MNFIRDLFVALNERSYWFYYGFYDVKLEFRETKLGFLWPILTAIIWIGGLTYLFSSLLSKDSDILLPYICIGIIFWNFISQSIAKGCRSISSSSYLVGQFNIQVLSHVMRSQVSVLTVTALQFTLVIATVAYFGKLSEVHLIPFLIGLLLIITTAFLVMAFLGVLSVVVADITPMVSALLRVLFWLSPVFWMPSMAPERSVLVVYNPVSYFLEIVRNPLMGLAVDSSTYVVVLSILVAMLAMSMTVYTLFKKELVSRLSA